MIIYRVQDSSGRGPWKPGFSHQWVIDRPDHSNLIPYFQEFPDFDPVKERLHGESLGCGCLSVPQLKRWFTKNEMLILSFHGYRAVGVCADRLIRHSDIQCIFAVRGAIKDKSYRINLYGI